MAAVGVMASDTRVPVPTARGTVPVTPVADAEMVTDPLFFPWAIPEDRIEATLGLDDFQARPARLVPTLPSLKVPVATNLIDVCLAILGFTGLMLMATKWAVDTVRPVEPLIEPKVAVTVVLPFAILVASPWPLTVATAGFEELHTTDAEISSVLLSLNEPVALN